MREADRTRIMDMVEEQFQRQRDRRIANQSSTPWAMVFCIAFGTGLWYVDAGALFNTDSGYFCLGGFALALLVYLLGKLASVGQRF